MLTVTVEEAGKLLGVSKPLVYNLIHSKSFPTVRIGRRVVIPKIELERWLSEQTNRQKETK